MQDDKILMWFAGLSIAALFLLMKWLNAKINKETKALTDSLTVLTGSLNEEKKQTVWRVDEIYKRIDLHKTHSHQSRKEVDVKMERLMTEAQVKDFVDRSLVPINKSLDSLNSSIEKVNDSTGAILISVQSLIDRDARSRKGD